MNVQSYSNRDGTLALRVGAPLRLAARAGELRVLEGAVWLTRRGDLDDHLLRAGERLQVGAADSAVLEAWQRDQTALVDWRPDGTLAVAQRRLRSVAGQGLGSLAGAATALAGSLRRAQAGVAGTSGPGAA